MRRSAATKNLLHASTWAVLFLTEVARAQTGAPPHREHVRFSYRAPEGCPSDSNFLDLVRTRDAEIIADAEAARAISITIDHHETWRATLEADGIANGKSTRSIDADSCEAVAKSIAIFTAIALREGSPDELPPAHPELAEKESLETPEEGFIPIARPIRSGPPVLDLYRGRFALTAGESLTMVNDGGRSLATAIGGAYFFSNVFGVGVEGALHLNLPNADESSDLVAVHALGYFELVFMRAKTSIFATDRGRTLDFFSRFGAGAMWARPRPMDSPAYLDHPYAAEFYFQPSLGVRVFVSNNVALLFQTHVDIYRQQNLDDRAADAQIVQVGGGPYDNVTYAVGGGFQIGITFFPSRAQRWPR